MFCPLSVNIIRMEQPLWHVGDDLHPLLPPCPPCEHLVFGLWDGWRHLTMLLGWLKNLGLPVGKHWIPNMWNLAALSLRSIRVVWCLYNIHVVVFLNLRHCMTSARNIKWTIDSANELFSMTCTFLSRLVCIINTEPAFLEGLQFLLVNFSAGQIENQVTVGHLWWILFLQLCSQYQCHAHVFSHRVNKKTPQCRPLGSSSI